MSKYWITRHWPHPQVDDLPWNVYLQHGERTKAAAVRPGDHVLFYVVRHLKVDGVIRHSIKKLADGTQVKLQAGAGAIVRVGEVTATVRERGRERIKYDYGDGDPMAWRYEIPCRTTDMAATVPHAVVKQVLGYGMRFPGSFRDISAQQYETLLQRARR